SELPTAQVVFATDYPQAVRDDDEVVAYVNAVRALGTEAQAVLTGANAGRLIPRLRPADFGLAAGGPQGRADRYQVAILRGSPRSHLKDDSHRLVLFYVL